MAKEYIERNAALDALYENEYTTLCPLDEVSSVIGAIPAADVVEVVRCEECRFSDTCSRTIELIPRQVQNGKLLAVVHYCEYGERRYRTHA